MSRGARIIAAAGALMMATATLSAADAVERFTFMPPNPPESVVDGKGPFQFTLNSWSTDAERERLHTAVATEGPAAALSALREVGTLGYLKWPGGLEYGIRYARQRTRPDGGVDVVLLADRPLWVWWEAAGIKPSTDYAFTLLQLQLDKAGRGQGHTSLTSAVKADKELGMALSDGAGAPALLGDIKRSSNAS
jgi:hypothetical protein